MMMNEIPMDSLTALVAERRRRYAGEAERFRLGRLALRSRRRDRRRRGPDGSAGTRVTAGDHDLCA